MSSSALAGIQKYTRKSEAENDPLSHETNLLSEWCSSGDDMKKQINLLSEGVRLGEDDPLSHATNLLSEGVRFGTSQKKRPRDSTRRTARGLLLLGMGRR